MVLQGKANTARLQAGSSYNEHNHAAVSGQLGAWAMKCRSEQGLMVHRSQPIPTLFLYRFNASCLTHGAPEDDRSTKMPPKREMAEQKAKVLLARSFGANRSTRSQIANAMDPIAARSSEESHESSNTSQSKPTIPTQPDLDAAINKAQALTWEFHLLPRNSVTPSRRTQRAPHRLTLLFFFVKSGIF